MANRAQRRAQAKKSGNGRVTPKKERAPRLFADVTDGAGNKKRIELHGDRVSEEEVKRAQEAQAERARQEAEMEANRRRFIAHTHGLWLPGDPLPGQ